MKSMFACGKTLFIPIVNGNWTQKHFVCFSFIHHSRLEFYDGNVRYSASSAYLFIKQKENNSQRTVKANDNFKYFKLHLEKLGSRYSLCCLWIDKTTGDRQTHLLSPLPKNLTDPTRNGKQRKLACKFLSRN